MWTVKDWNWHFRKKEIGNINGQHIISLNNSQHYVGDISKHVLLCPKSATLADKESSIKLLGEVKKEMMVF